MIDCVLGTLESCAYVGGNPGFVFNYEYAHGQSILIISRVRASISSFLRRPLGGSTLTS
jgi:hypothetical protein